MAAKPTMGTAGKILKSIKVRPFCDSNSGVRDLTPEQQAAMHAFLHEVLAAYYRMSILVPEDAIAKILSHRFDQALKGK